MIRLICLWGVLCAAVWLSAQPCNVLTRIEADSVLRREWNALCARNLSFKVEEARRLRLDTLPEIEDMLDAYRKQVVSGFWMTEGRLSAVSSKELRIRISQLFFSLPQNLPQRKIREMEQRMDSLYAALCRGNSFSDCVRLYSDDKELHWIGRLEMPVEMEEAVWKLPVGTVSKPFFTPLGLHVVKVLARDSVAVSVGGGHVVEKMAAQVRQLKKKYRYVEHPKGKNEWLASGRTSRVIFSLDGKEYREADINRFAGAYPARRERQWKAFVSKTLLDRAYSGWLARDSVSRVLAEYRETLLARAACRSRILQDNVGHETDLQSYFQSHTSDYRWENPRFYGLVIHAASKQVAKQVRRFFKKLPSKEWEDAIRLAFHPDKQKEVRIEKGVFALGDNAYVDDLVYKKADALPFEHYPYTVVLGKKQKKPQSYQEVRAAVWRDLLADWELKWMMERKRKKDG